MLSTGKKRPKQVPTGATTATASADGGSHPVTIKLEFKRYIFDPNKEMVQ